MTTKRNHQCCYEAKLNARKTRMSANSALLSLRDVCPTADANEQVFTSSIDDFLPGLGLQHSVVGVKGLTYHEDDHGHGQHPQQGHASLGQQRGAGQDG